MLIRLLIGTSIGLLGGGALGYFGKCTSGACPLTANPLRGALVGMFFGAMLAMVISTTGCRPQKQTAPDRSTHVTTAQQFDAHVLKADKPVLVDFYATWCAPCKPLAPIINDLAGEYEGRANFVKVDGDKSRDLISQYGVRGYPTVVIFSGGKPVKKLVGLRGAAEYRSALDAAIAGAK